MSTTVSQHPSLPRDWANHPGWSRATFLKERLALLQAESDTSQALDFDSERADLRLRIWKEQSPFNTEEAFSAYLEQMNMEEMTLRSLLGESAESLSQRIQNEPDWLQELLQIFAAPVSNEEGGASIILALANNPSLKMPTLSLFSPLLISSEANLRAGIAELARGYPDLPFEIEAVCHSFLLYLARLIQTQTIRALTLELHVARAEQRLTGGTAEERFQAFIAHMKAPDVLLTFLEEYAPLARCLMLMCKYWLAFALEFLRHLCADWETLRRELFAGQEPGKLVDILCGEGDSHKQGRSTLKLSFSSGEKLLYKPKSLAVDLHFQELLSWLNGRGDHPPFRLTRVIDRGKYGWSEFIPTAPCSSTEELARFYERQGGYLALFYALEMTDVHFENLIASGEHPVMIDLESLFHPRMEFAITSNQAQNPARALLARSVLRIGMLPQRLWRTQQMAGVDMSGLGGRGGQLTPRPVLQIKEFGTDQAHYVREHIQMPGKQNMPTLAGEPVELLDYQKQLITGFTNVYRLILRERAALMDGPLQTFAHDEIRVIMRATSIYGQLLVESTHPDLLRDALDRERFFAHLWNATLQQPLNKRVFAYEVTDLHEGDTPMFTSRPDTCAIYSSRGDCIPDFLERPSLESVAEHLLTFNERDLIRQVWIIQASLAAQVMATGHQVAAGPKAPAVYETATPAALIQKACTVGDRLYDLALTNEGGAYWLALQCIDEREWAVWPAQNDLYNGIGGICLFLAYLGQVSGQAKYTDLARQALVTIRIQTGALREVMHAPGGYDGWGGMIYLYTHLGMLWNDTTLLAEAQEFAAILADCIEQDEALDVISGSAGAIAALLALYEVRADPALLATAIQCGEHLLSKAPQCSYEPGRVEQPVTMPIAASQPLAGFSHGAAGIALNLLRLASVSGDARFRAGALACIAYERQIFSPEQGNWPDFRLLGGERDSLEEKQYMLAWCHGAPGIALARLAGLAYLDDAAVREEIAAALHTTLEGGFGLNHSLCHGDLGNLESLLVAAQLLAEPHYIAEVRRLKSQILAGISQHGWRTGVPLGAETPGLMTGIAGIGYQLLRLARPELVPAVLTLAPPVAHPSVKI